jgi:hypothetical protein
LGNIEAAGHSLIDSGFVSKLGSSRRIRFGLGGTSFARTDVSALKDLTEASGADSTENLKAPADDFVFHERAKNDA